LTGDFGELPYLMNLSQVTSDLLRELWRSVDPTGDAKEVEASLNDAAARGSWVTENLHVDLGLLRAAAVAADQPSHPSASAVGLGVVLAGGAFALLDARQLLDRNPGDRVARHYTGWIFNKLIAPRWTEDPALRDELITYLNNMLRLRPGMDKVETEVGLDEAPPEPSLREPGEGPDQAPVADIPTQVARMLAGRVFDALPEPLQEALAADPTFLEYAARQVHHTISLGGDSFDLAEVAPAVAAALRGTSAEVRAIGSGVTARFDRGEAPHLVTVSLDTSRRLYHIDDPGFMILAPDQQTCIAAMVGQREQLDLERGC
jgi:hypothetical protein